MLLVIIFMVGIAAGVLTGALNLAVIFLAERRYRELPELPELPVSPSTTNVAHERPLPRVTIIIPARNESTVIARVVHSVRRLTYPTANYSAIVVDDASTDDTGTKAIAAGAAVITLAGSPPAGWTGKCNACDTAVRQLEPAITNDVTAPPEDCSDWLLFTDADTCHHPDSLMRVVRYAEDHNLDAVSLLLQQECGTFWERITLPLAYQNFFATLNPQTPTFNGQYILIRREVYVKSGGFGAVRGRVMEDVALAASLSAQGYRIALLNGHSAASVRMYQNLPALVRGMTKTAFIAARDRGRAGVLLALPYFLGVFTVPCIVLGIALNVPVLMSAWSLVYGITALGVLAWMRRFAVSRQYAVAIPVGVMLLWYAGFTSTFRHLLGRGVRWKDRTIIEG